MLQGGKCTSWEIHLAFVICIIFKYKRNYVEWECDTKHVPNFYHCRRWHKRWLWTFLVKLTRVKYLTDTLFIFIFVLYLFSYIAAYSFKYYDWVSQYFSVSVFFLFSFLPFFFSSSPLFSFFLTSNPGLSLSCLNYLEQFPNILQEGIICWQEWTLTRGEVTACDFKSIRILLNEF